MKKPLVSVIVPVFNEEKYLEFCLSSLKKQSWKKTELIVVDDGSTDGSIKIAQKYADLVLQQNHQGPGAARNFGAKNSKGEILVFVDGDMKFHHRYIEYLIKPILEKNAIGTFHDKELVANYENIWARCWNINNNLNYRSRLPKKIPKSIGIYRAILRKFFEKVGGFDSSKGYKDDETIWDKLQINSMRAKKAICYHFNPSSIKEVFSSAKWIGKSGFYHKNFNNFLRFSFLNSFRVAFKKILFNKAPIEFLIFKIIYDFGLLWGIFFGKKGGPK